MLAKCFQRTVTSNLSVIKYRVLRKRQFYEGLFTNEILSIIIQRSPYFGHGVIFEIKSSTASVMPLTSNTEPIPFHSVFIP